MINSMCWIITIVYNIGAIYLLRRMFKRLGYVLNIINKDVSRLKLDAHTALNKSADNTTNIMAHHLEWKELQARNVEMYSSRLNYATQECNKKREEFENQVLQNMQERFACLDEDLIACNKNIRERDEAIDQQLTDVYACICKYSKDKTFIDEGMETLPKPRGRPKKKPPSTPSIEADGWKSSWKSTLSVNNKKEK